MTDRDALLAQIKDKAVVHGKVVLSSGKEADYYVDLRRVTLDSEASPLVGSVLLDLTADLEFDAVGGLTLGADPVATAMMHAASAHGRRFYNANVRTFNTKVETFPPNVVARLFNFVKQEYFEAEDPTVRAAPEVRF